MNENKKNTTKKRKMGLWSNVWVMKTTLCFMIYIVDKFFL